MRAALVRAAIRLAKKAGPEGVTLRGVARAVGVSEAAPYHHFRDRRELLIASAAESFRALSAAVLRVDEDESAGVESEPAALVSLARRYARFAVENRGQMRLILGAHVVDEGLDAVSELREAASPVVLALEAAVARALPDASLHERERFGNITWAQVHGVVSLVVEKELRPVPTAEQAADLAAEAVGLLVRGARAVPVARARPRGRR